MEKFQQKRSPRGSLMCNNTGGPRSRQRAEPIKRYFLAKKKALNDYGSFGIKIPEDIEDIEGWLLQIATQEGMQSWQEIIQKITLPNDKMMVIDLKDSSTPKIKSNLEILKDALILSRSNQFYYLPDGPHIFTKSRLTRRIRLININLKNYYELD